MASKSSFRSGLLSRQRSCLSGLAAILILCVHSCMFLGDDTPAERLASAVFHYGSIGVPIFGFLGGVGLYYSLIKRPRLRDFYKRRFRRVFLPFLCIAGIWYAYEFLISDFDILSFFCAVSTLGFWTGRATMWYIAMLLPVYLLFPFYSRWLEKGKRGPKTAAVIALVFLLMAAVYHSDPSLYLRMHLVFRTLALMLCGYYLGERVMKNDGLSVLWAVVPVVVSVAYRVIFGVFHWARYEPLSSFSFAFLALPISLALSALFERMGSRTAALKSLGTVTLESYIWNRVLINLQQTISSRSAFFRDRRFLIYVLLIPVGILLSYLSRRALQRGKAQQLSSERWLS